MVKKIKKTQEEEIITMLQREGFRELSINELETEPYKSVYTIPDCFTSRETWGRTSKYQYSS